MIDTKYLKEIRCGVTGIKLLRPTTKEKKLIRKIVFDGLPSRWSVRAKTRLASKVADSNPDPFYNSFSIKQRDRKITTSAKASNKARHNLRKAALFINEDYRSGGVHNGYYQEAIRTTGITHAQFGLALATLRAAANFASPIFIAKQESKNTTTERGEYDLFIGRLLVSHGVNIKTAALIITAIRTRHPFVAAYESNPVIIRNEQKESRAVLRRLQDAGMR